MTRSLFSYVVRYDSAFAPNPFHGFCTLATCKPNIRKSAQIDDWVIGRGSHAKGVRRGGYVVYAMRVTETVSTAQYWNDPRFQKKKPDLYRNWVCASGDNIYRPEEDGSWSQLSSYHSENEKVPDTDHIARDTGTPRILISNQFVYFGCEGPKLPSEFLNGGEFDLLRAPRGSRWRNERATVLFEDWFNDLDTIGYQGKPWDWVHGAKR